MRQTFALLLAVMALSVSSSAQGRPAWLDPYRGNAEKLMTAATADQFAWDRVAELTDTYGQRISGSENLNRAIAWAAETMKKDGLENVHTERVMVPKWVRGVESLEITNPPHHIVPMIGLGGSVATPPDGIEAEVMVVANRDELTKRSAEAKGKIVLFNVPYTNYGETVAYRSGGATMAAQHGAVAALVRAVGPTGLRTPHTGGMNYADGVAKIPTAAIPAEDTMRIQRLANRGLKVRLRLKMEAHFEADVESFNVVGEIRGSEKPDEIVLVGGHFDSWDTGTGASDDGVSAIHVRAFAPAHGVPEDPVCGSGNGAVAAYRLLKGQIGDGDSYLASQGREVGRDGQVHIRIEGADVHVGGVCVTCVTGSLSI